MHMSRITGKYWGILLIAVAGWQGMGCDNKPAMTDNAVDEQEPVQSSPAGESTTWGGSTASASEFWSPFSKSSRMIALDEECCNTTGHANECWEEDALADDVAGNIFCKTDADCGVGTCNTGPDVKAALAGYSRIQAAGYEGLCQCSGDEDCRDASGDGGMCFFFGDDGTGTEVSVCGPSMCNGYYVCSCWGGCVWWDGNNAENTPADDAATVGLHCCENRAYSDPRTDSGIVLFGNATCKYECDEDKDCLAPSVHDPDMVDDCVAVSCNTVLNTCQYTPLTGTECDLDGLGCSVDRCTAAGGCVYSGLRCGTDATYIDSSGNEQLNTCVETCREDPTDVDGNSETWMCNVNLSVPSDPSQDPNGICDWWTCEDNGSGTNEPIHNIQDCVAKSDASFCFDYECDPSGTQGNCDTLSAAVTRANESCGDAESMGAFAAGDPDGARLSVYGDSRCAANDHNAGAALDCTAQNFPSWSLGYGFNDSTAMGGRDLVYSFTYVPSGSTAAKYKYVVQLEGIYNNDGEYFDPAVYLSTTCDTGSVAVDAEACEISYGSRIDEDQCQYPDVCQSIEGSTAYEHGDDGAYYAMSDIDEITDGSTDPVTVYVYVDSDDRTVGGGEFYLSVTRESLSACPSPGDSDFFYDGKVYQVILDGTYDFAIPVNGSNFDPVAAAEQVQTGTLGTVTGIVVKGDTSIFVDGKWGNYYNPGGSSSHPDHDASDIFAFNGNDQLWELDVQMDDVRVGVSLCDYGGDFDDTPDDDGDVFDPMLAVFDCHGNRINYNDNGFECLGNGSQIRPTLPMSTSDGPYYVLVDGRYMYPGSSGSGVGSQGGGKYDLSIFYDPVTETTCDPDGADAGNGIALTLPSGGEPEIPVWDTDPTTPDHISFVDGCVLIEDGMGDWPCDGIAFNTNNVGPTGSPQKCYPGSGDDEFSYCMDPMILTFTMYYSSSTVAGKTCTYSTWMTSEDGHFNDLGAYNYLLLYESHPSDPECDVFEHTAMAFKYNPGLTPTQLANCVANCEYMTSLYIRHSNPCTL